MAGQTIQCSECGRVWRGKGDWNVIVKQGLTVGYLCPGCQTPEQNAEAEINAATLDYGYSTDALGRQRLTGRPK